jgi:hypothetical protein
MTREEQRRLSAGGLWRVASFTQVRPMDLFCDVWLYPTLTEQDKKEGFFPLLILAVPRWTRVDWI